MGPGDHCHIVDHHFPQFRECPRLGTLTVPFGQGTQVDLAPLKLDLGGSNVQVISTTGPGIVQLQLDDGTTVSQPFTWDNVNDAIVLSDPASVESWIDSFNGNISAVSVSVTDLTVESVDGGNTVVTEIKYGDVLLDADTSSWYYSSSDCSGMFPNHQLCF